MKFTSTRNEKLQLTAAEAIVKGLSDDGGLFVPVSFPAISADEFLGRSYFEIAEIVLGKFLDADFSADEIAAFVHAAYDDALPAALSALTETESVLELFHGHTAAFKDVALQLLPHLLSASLQKLGEKRRAVILTATSGDTGSAVMSGFAEVAQTEVIVFYPAKGISDIQRLQMTTQSAENVHAVALRGNFDDAQQAVKAIFQDTEFVEKFSADSFFTSANSINFGRLLPQIVYYFWAYSALATSGRIKPDEAIDFSVPTGNFGNILAGFYAKKMGLPVSKLICATNKNAVLFDFFETGIYDRNRAFHVTNSPSMDILVSSNFERLIHAFGGEKMVLKTQAALEKTGRYEVPADILGKMKETFVSYTLDDLATSALIADAAENHAYVLDPHTAVAYGSVAYERAMTDVPHHAVILATASPYKFDETVARALGRTLPAVQAPSSLSGLTERAVTQTRQIDKTDVRAVIQEVLSHDEF
ncbi:MAG: threonine synthase [Streptococcaceae bacterium]|jgi:threonine synthase|nr:threonine synthase [Streptococcaceae bacterium]